MSAFRPSMMAATQITLVTPMTMPRIVRAERTLRERIVSIATTRFSLMSPMVMSFRPQRDHGVELRRLDGGVDPEEESDHRAQDDAQSRHPDLDGRRKRSELPQGQGAGETDGDADSA